MFTVLDITERKNTVFERLFGWLIRDEYEMKTVGIYKGAPFYQLNVRIGKRGLDTQKVIDCVGKCSRRLVTNNVSLLPENNDFGIFKSNVLYCKMMQNTFLKILYNNEINKNPLPICVIDKNARFTDFDERLCDYASSLTIFTDKKDKYKYVCDSITENTGLCPMLKNGFTDEKIVIDLDNNIMRFYSDMDENIIENGEEFIVPEIYNYLKPQSIDKYDFYSALYELCGVFCLADCNFETIWINNEKKSVTAVHFS